MMKSIKNVAKYKIMAKTVDQNRTMGRYFNGNDLFLV